MCKSIVNSSPTKNHFFNHTLNKDKGVHSIVCNIALDWGVSLTNHNPESKDFIFVSCEEEAFRLQKLLAKLTPISTDSPISIP